MARVNAAPSKTGNRRRRNGMRHPALNLALLSAMPLLSTAQTGGQCVPLKGSKRCPAFDGASVSTGKSVLDTYPFLQYVSDVDSFDTQLDSFVKTGYVQARFEGRFGCGGVDLRNSSNMYARWTTTVICSSMVQMSVDPCGLAASVSKPLCADSCAEFAQSEAYITSNSNLCRNPRLDLTDLIRADYTVCGLPVKALAGDCIPASQNEAENCGFGSSTLGLCGYCGAGGTNSTDTCCYNSKAESRCEGVKLPSITASVPLTSTPTSTSSNPTATSPTGENGNGAPQHGKGLSGGAIAGVVIGALAGVALLALLLFFCVRLFRRRRANSSQAGSIFNQPSPARKVTPAMAQQSQSAPQGYEVLPGGRIARMSALEGHSGGSPSQHNKSLSTNEGGNRSDSRKVADQSSSDEYVDSPEFEHRDAGLRPPPMTSRRHGSLSSGSVLGSDGQMSPLSAGYSSPRGFGSQQSEQLPFFKDYYSQDDIHPGDKVAVLWAYSPRAGDEFSLERGDMIKVVGIWDDGWATGHMQEQRAEEWEASRAAQRDSGVSNSSIRDDSQSPPVPAAPELKAFPLVCVCLPQHWRKTIEGDGSTDPGSAGSPAGQVR
ncbi:SH3 domain containing protein [Cordyceps militaris CM01]|uniref:SH3 domain containing protein n=1 Tax=Cordyceps militaris (strain CM01) TaxID=983644 RepID=G3JE77_CORMM|nr:SH3 domain containing protein [Cordyceps militaris CM01]EGX92902.1 SH3 domain containing protein [Cordyceps militaris CM01]